MENVNIIVGLLPSVPLIILYYPNLFVINISAIKPKIVFACWYFQSKHLFLNLSLISVL